MRIIITDNEKYREWACVDKDLEGYALKPYVHYFPDDVFEVIPYRHNPNNFFEVEFVNLNEKQKKICPKVGRDSIFWIDPKHTIEWFDLPEELFKI